MRLRAALYARQSEDRKGDMLAIDRQMPKLEALAERRGVEVLYRFVDNDISSKGHKKRPGFDKMIKAARESRIDVIIGPDWYRLSRNRRESLQIFEVGQERGLLIFLVKGQDIDLSNPGGRLVAGLLAEVARNEIDVKAERQKDANQQRAERGIMRWSVRPFGYDLNDAGDIVVVRAEASMMQRSARALLKDPAARIAPQVRKVNAAGLTTTRGGPFTVTTWRRILLNPRYSGRVTYNGRDVTAGSWPVILKPDVQDQVRMKLTDPKRLLHNGIGVKYLLSGICLCGRCGKKMFATSADSGARMVYRCMPAGHVQRGMADVDEVVQGLILGRLERPDALSLLVPDIDLDVIRSELVDVRERRDAIVAMIADRLVSHVEGRAQASKLTQEIELLEGQVAAALGESPLTPFANSDASPRELWGQLPLVKRRSVITAIADVTVLPQGKGMSFDPKSVMIDWKV